jgi:hypothetical protein
MADKILRCPRCGTLTPIAKGECVGCGLRMVKKKKTTTPAEASETSESQAAPAPSPPPPDESGPHLEVTDDRTGIMPKLMISDDEPTAPDAEPTPAPEPEVSKPLESAVEGLETEEDANPKIADDGDGMASVLMGTAIGEDEVGEEDAVEEEPAAADWMMSIQDHDGQSQPESEGADESDMPKLSLQDPLDAYGEEEPNDDDAPYDEYGVVGGEGFESEDQLDLDTADIPAAGMPGDGYGETDGPLDVDRSQMAEVKPRKRGPMPSEIVCAHRKRTAKRRYFTRVMPLLIFGLVLWYGGKGYGVSYFIPQGEWTGVISEVDFELNEKKASIKLDIEHDGRRITGSFDLNCPMNENGKMDKSKTPKILHEVFTSSRGVVVGEFDLGKARFKLYNSDPDVALEFSGEIRRDADRFMFIRDEAFNTEDSLAQIEIKRNSLY